MTTGNTGRARRRWAFRLTTAVIVAGSLAAVTADLSAAQATPTTTKKVQVVKVVIRKPFGKMLATTHGASLYYKPKGGCTGECLTVWPPLVMKKGSTATPTGTKCLATAKFNKLRQVTYRGHRLYTFTGDSGSSVNGNGEGGFVVAKVSTKACPKPTKSKGGGGGGGGW